MSKEVFVFEVSQHSFGQTVVMNSYKLPVFVEFMGVWSEPSVMMSDLFSGLAKEFAEEFVFAKVDIDEQTELRDEYSIKNIPTLIVFKDGKPVRTEEGQLQEVEARDLLRDFGVFRESDLLCEQAREKHLAGDTPAAILLLTEAIQGDPGNTRIAMDMTQVFIDLAEYDQAKALFGKLPEADKQTEMGKALNGQLIFADLAANTPAVAVLTQKLADNPEDYDAHFDMAIRLVSGYEYEKAIDHLFLILEKDEEYKEGAAKEFVFTVANMIAPVNNDMTMDIRRRLANLLTN